MISRSPFKLMGVIVGIAMLTFLVDTPNLFSAPVPGITDDTILIGNPTVLTGPAGDYSRTAFMNKTILEQWGGTIHGRKIKVLIAGHNLEPAKGVAIVKKMIHEDQVFMIHGMQGSNVGLAVRPVVIEAGIPWVLQGEVNDAIVNPVVKNIFNPGYGSSAGAITMADFAMTIPGVKRIGIIRNNDEWSMSLYKPLIQHLKEKYNITPIEEVVTERGVPDLAPQVLILKKAKLDVVLAPIYVQDTTNFLREAYKLGLDIPIIGGTATHADDQLVYLKTVAPLKKYFDPYHLKYPMDHPRVKPYRELFEKYCPQYKFDSIAVVIAGGALVILDALEKCGRDLTREKFCEILETRYTNWEPDNYIQSTPLTFSRTRHIGIDKLSMCTAATGKLEVVKTYADYEKLMKK